LALICHSPTVAGDDGGRKMGWPSNENGPDVKLGSKRQGRYRLLDWEKPEKATLGRDSWPTR
jgi:hypothetical protein